MLNFILGIIEVKREEKREVEKTGWLEGSFYCPCGCVFGENSYKETPLLIVFDHSRECEEAEKILNGEAIRN